MLHNERIRESCTTVYWRSCRLITVQQPCCCTMGCTRNSCTSTVTGDHSNQDPGCTQKTYILPFFCQAYLVLITMFSRNTSLLSTLFCEVQNRLYDTITVQQPCCCTMNATIILHFTEDRVVRSPYDSNRVAVQWNVYENLVPRSLVPRRCDVQNRFDVYSNHVAQWLCAGVLH